MPGLEKQEVTFYEHKLLLTVAQIAKIYGVSRNAVQRWDKPKSERSDGVTKLYDAKKIILWHKDNINIKQSQRRSKVDTREPSGENPFSDLPDSDVPKEELERRNEYEKLRKSRLNNEILEGNYIPVDDVDKTMATLAVMLMSSLKNHEKSAPTELANKKSHEIHKLIKDAHYDVTDRLDRLVKKEFDCDETLYEVIGAALKSLDKGMTPKEIIDRIES